MRSITSGRAGVGVVIAMGRAVMTAPSRGSGEADVGPIGIPPDPRASSVSDEVVVCAGRIGLGFRGDESLCATEQSDGGSGGEKCLVGLGCYLLWIVMKSGGFLLHCFFEKRCFVLSL